MKYQQTSYAVPGVFVLLLSAVLLSLASCGGGGGGGGGSPAIPLTASAITAGDDHTCAVLSTGAAYCWGLNANGQLGDHSTDESKVPVAVSTLDSGVAVISAGSAHTCAVLSTGAAQCWGFKGNGRLGNGDVIIGNQNVPMLVGAADSQLSSGVAAISAGASHTCVILSTGAAQCWGLNSRGMLGDGGTETSNIPVQVEGLDSQVTAISAGTGHTCAIHRTAGKHAAKCWGGNNKGQLGNGDGDNKDAPVPVGGELVDLVTDISAGLSHTCAVQDGKAWCWGDNNHGQLGTNFALSGMLSEVPVTVEITNGGPQLSGVSAISAGNFYTCALLATGVVQCWGLNSNGQLGVDTSTASSNFPVQVEGLESQVTAISAGAGHTCALLDSGVVQCWGGNGNGQLGVGTLSGGATLTSTPQTVREP